MKNVIPQKLIFPFILSFIFSVSFTLAQEPDAATPSKDELKLIKLEEKVKRAQNKISATEAKIAKADSLMQAGIEMKNEADAEMDVIVAEEKQFTKEQTGEVKILRKQLKKADNPKSIENEIKVMQSDFNKKIKKFDSRFKIEVKRLDKGKMNQTKAKDKLKQYNPKLKEYQKSLELAETLLEEFKTEKDM